MCVFECMCLSVCMCVCLCVYVCGVCVCVCVCVSVCLCVWDLYAMCTHPVLIFIQCGEYLTFTAPVVWILDTKYSLLIFWGF